MKQLQYGFTAEQIIEEARVAAEDVEEIQTWLPEQNMSLSNEQIVLYLLSCCNQVEFTKKTISAQSRLLKEIPEVANNRNLNRQDLQNCLEVIEICISPERDDDGCAVAIIRLKDTNYRKFDMIYTMTILSMIMEAALVDYPPTGLITIGDMSGTGLMHLTKIKLKLVRVFFQMLQEALPVQMKGMHILNTVYFIDKLMGMVKPFVSKSVMDLIHFHPRNTDMEKFARDWVPKRCLPKDYGGDLPSFSELHGRTVEKLWKMMPHFEAEEELRRAHE